MNVEARLHEKIGSEVAGKLHTGRSRNDQVCVDMRMYSRGVSAIPSVDVELSRRLCWMWARTTRMW